MSLKLYLVLVELSRNVVSIDTGSSLIVSIIQNLPRSLNVKTVEESTTTTTTVV